MTTPPSPLSSVEAATWRALARVMTHLARTLDDDLVERDGLTMTRYVVLMELSEAPGGRLRMGDLAHAAMLSPSRMTRVVQGLVDEGYVARGTVDADARARSVTLTPDGLARLERAWPAHVAGVRTHVLDRIDPEDLPGFRRVLEAIHPSDQNFRGPSGATT